MLWLLIVDKGLSKAAGGVKRVKAKPGPNYI